jgi:hypothetical protein
MKVNELFISLILIVFGLQPLCSQTVLQGFSFQGIARDNAGNELVNKSLTMKLAVVSDSAKGPVQWEETHNVITNQYGIYNLTVGQGASTGIGAKSSFREMDWGSAYHFLKVSINFGTGLLDMGTMQLIPVPYALYAEKSGEGALGEVKMFALSLSGAVTREALQAKGWAICDGTSTNSQGILNAVITTTPDLKHRFIQMSNDGSSGTIGGSASSSHNHASATYNGYGMAGSPFGSTSGPSKYLQGSSSGSSGHTTYDLTSSTTVATIPPYYELVFFIKVK